MPKRNIAELLKGTRSFFLGSLFFIRGSVFLGWTHRGSPGLLGNKTLLSFLSSETGPEEDPRD